MMKTKKNTLRGKLWLLFAFIFPLILFSQIVRVFPFENKNGDEEYQWLGDCLQLVMAEKLSYFSEIDAISDENTNVRTDFILDGSFECIADAISVSVVLYDKSGWEIAARFGFQTNKNQLLSKLDDLAIGVATKTNAGISIGDSFVQFVPTASIECLEFYYAGLQAIAENHFLDGIESLEKSLSHDPNFFHAMQALFHYSSHFPINPGYLRKDVENIEERISIENTIVKLLPTLSKNIYSGTVIDISVAPDPLNLEIVKINLQLQYEVDAQAIQRCVELADSLGFHWDQTDDIYKFEFSTTQKYPDNLLLQIKNRQFAQVPIIRFRTKWEETLLLVDGQNLAGIPVQQKVKQFQQFLQMFTYHANPWDIHLVISKEKQVLNYSFSTSLDAIADVREIVVDFYTATEIQSQLNN